MKRARKTTRRPKQKAPRRRPASSAIKARASEAAANVEAWGRRFEAARHVTDALFPLPPGEIKPLETFSSARGAYTRPWSER